MARNGSSDTLIGIAGIGSAIAGIGAFLQAPGGPRWDLLLPIAAGCVVFFGALLMFDRKMVRTGRVSEGTAVLVILGSILAGIVVLVVLAGGLSRRWWTGS